MTRWWTVALVTAVFLVTFYVAMILVARRLPPGPMRDLVRLLPDLAQMLRALHRDPRVPRRAKAALWVAFVWVISPIDLIPEFLPVIGPLDDVVVVVLVLRYVVRTSPREAVEEAWPGQPALLHRLLPPSGGSRSHRRR